MQQRDNIERRAIKDHNKEWLITYKIMNLNDIKPEDIPLILDATFALAVHAYSLSLWAGTKVLGNKLPDNFEIKDVLLSRFLAQGFNVQQSDKISSMINDCVTKMIKDAERELSG